MDKFWVRDDTTGKTVRSKGEDIEILLASIAYC